ncbi:hypothetical protein T07_6377 [Trichinella nelsoni]|uniref:Uncharacterized protein n=1 Tax=Trichinella nelsoni TaxID=6336 RepID=A0A0V0RBY4_9BILA|nr:hypothetical protein T07_6377 [Trichinella nelsoni]
MQISKFSFFNVILVGFLYNSPSSVLVVECRALLCFSVAVALVRLFNVASSCLGKALKKHC